MNQQLTRSVNSLKRKLTDRQELIDQPSINKVMMERITETNEGPAAKKRLIEEQEEIVTIQDIQKQLNKAVRRITETLEKKIQQHDSYWQA